MMAIAAPDHIRAAAPLRAFAREVAMGHLKIEWDWFRAQVVEHRVQLGFSLRVTTAAVVSFVVSLLLHVPLPLWTVLTAVILTQVNFGRSVKATVDYLAGTLGGAVYSGAVAALVPHPNEMALAGTLVLAVAPLALLGAIKPSFSAATFTGVLVLLVPGIAHVGPIESAVYRVIEVAVGGITALAVSLVLPARAGSSAIEAAGHMLVLAARSLPELFAGFMQTRDAAAIARIQDGLGQAFARLDAMATEARHERIGFLAAAPELGPLLRTLLRLRHDLVMIGRAAGLPLPETFQARLGAPLARVAEAVEVYLRRSGEALTARRAPPPLAAVDAALDGYAQALAEIRRDGLTQDLPVDTVERIFAAGFALEQIHQHLRDLERCVREVARRR
jgi:uncharacterized membrane protein YccC